MNIQDYPECYYPTWICHECGAQAGNRIPGISTWHTGTCGICMCDKSVTEPRDFGHLKLNWRDLITSNK